MSDSAKVPVSDITKLLLKVLVFVIAVVVIVNLFNLIVGQSQPVVERINSTPYKYGQSDFGVLKDSEKLHEEYKNLLRDWGTEVAFDYKGYLRNYPNDAVTISYIKADGQAIINIFSNADSAALIARYNKYR